MTPGRDLTGQRFGRLTALRYSDKNDGRKAWVCLCDCGVEAEIRGANLRAGKTSSCGCFKRERMAEGLVVRHGMTATPVHKTWDAMLQRCTNPKAQSFERYGGRGITVCDRWTTFENFYADMGDRPEGMTLDRIDNDRGYQPDNCRWATRREQSNNISTNRQISYQGKDYTARELSDLTGAPYQRLRDRIFKMGWTSERAINEPVQAKPHQRTQ